ncbi:MAG: regulatory protein RecX, partial [Plesiomonas shigelloides]
MSNAKIDAMNSAMAMLARRDYGRAELKAKLLAKGVEALDADMALDACEARGYLCEHRYGATLVRVAVAKGHGLARVRQAMRAKGLEPDMIDQSLQGAGVDWYAQARVKALKKFGATKPVDAKDRAKRIRYLLGQGFN